MADTTAPHGTLVGTPVFSSPVTNRYGLTDAGDYASPSLVDIDADGDLDALIGNYQGNTRVYLNTGTASSPAFAAASTNPYGLGDVGYLASPSFVDIDGDGDLDAFIGNNYGTTLVYLNTGTASSPAFAAASTNPYGLGNGGSWVSPSFVDIDGDGDLDAFIGRLDGNTRVYLNTGTASSPAFAAASTNPYGLGNVGGYADPSLVDIDGDGDLDAFIGNTAGNTLVYLNTGSVVAPVTSSKANGSYGVGSVITLTVAFSENVFVAGGTPTLTLETGTTDRAVSYSSGSGTKTLTFTYTVQAGDTSADLDFISSSALVLNGSSIRDAAGNNAVLTLAAPGAAGSLAANKNLVIETIAPTATLTAASLANTASVTVQSTEAGMAYLVNTLVVVTDLASITGASGTSWNAVPITTANSNTALSATGLVDGSYKLYTTDAAGNLSAVSSGSVIIDSTAPTATLTAASLPNTASVTVQSTEAGMAYLVNTSVVVTDLASITGASGTSWNTVAIAAADTPSALSAADLADGTYKLYTTDAAGNLSAASTNSVIIDSTAPTATLTAATLTNTGSATVQSTDAGTAYLVNTSVTVTDLASITGASGINWNAVAITTADTDTALFTTGLRDGSYKLYTVDALGNLSAVSTGSVTLDSTAPHGTLAGTPVFSSPVANAYGLSDVGDYASPSLADIDGDGDLDAFVGDYDGNMLVYLNTGSASSPAFAAPATNPYGLSDVGDYAKPSLADIDGDGDLDVFVGGLDGNTRVFINTGSASSPAFALPVSNPYGLRDVGNFASPGFADIDGDGDLDAFVGNGAGNTLVFLNTGSASSPAFAVAVTNPYGLSDVGNVASPSFADIDGDGDLDALIGNNAGNMRVFLNTGSVQSPAFAVPVTNPWGLSDVGSNTSPSFVDIDGDGDLDALMGNGEGEMQVFLNTGTFGVVAPVSSSTANGSHGVGRVITLQVAFSETVWVAGGTPTLTLETGTTDRLASYSSGSGTGTLTFTYTVQAGDSSADLDFISSSALALNGATVRDAAGNDAILTLAVPGATGSLAANAALVIDGTAPTLLITSSASTLGVGDTAQITFSFSEDPGSSFAWDGSSGDVFVTGGSLSAISGSGLTRTAIFTPTAGIAAGSANITVASATYTDAAGNDGGAGSAPGISYDTFNAVLTGGAGADTLNGAGGNDRLVGRSGADQLDGGEGNDSLFGQDGNDQLLGGKGKDALNGGTGADTMTGGDGSDIYYVDDAGDVVIETETSVLLGGSDTVYSYLSSYILTDNVERGTIKTSAAASLTGNGLDNIIYGGNGNDSLFGAAGDDTLTGGKGADQLTGGAGRDLLAGGLGADSFIFQSGSGRDTVKDFNHAEGDIISLQSNLNGSGITDAASALAHVHDAWGSAVLDLGGGNVVKLTGLMTADLTVADFAVF